MEGTVVFMVGVARLDVVAAGREPARRLESSAGTLTGALVVEDIVTSGIDELL